MFTKIADTPACSGDAQYFQLYSDAAHTVLFGWMYVYNCPGTNTSIECWAIVDRDNVNLYGTQFYMQCMDASKTPATFADWFRMVEDGPSFGAFIYRVACSYTSVSVIPREELSIMGTKAYGIYNVDKEGKAELVAITLQQSAHAHEAVRRFRQVSLYLTMDAPLYLFGYTDVNVVHPPVSFDQFITNNGVLQLHMEDWGYILTESCITANSLLTLRLHIPVDPAKECP